MFTFPNKPIKILTMKTKPIPLAYIESDVTLAQPWPFPKHVPVDSGPKMVIKLGGNSIKEAIKADNKFLRSQAVQQNIGIVHIFDKENTLGGLTIAFRKVSKYPSGRMVEVAVATCSIEDTFSKKLGTSAALAKFFDGETIQLPLLQWYTAEEDLPFVVKQAFTALYREI
jgi:hypothetical protein